MFNPYVLKSPPAIPKLYWDAYSQEQRIKMICQCIDALYESYNGLVGNVNELVGDTSQKFDDLYADMVQRVAQLRRDITDMLAELTKGQLQWDCQLGDYRPTIDAQRDMFNDVTVHSMTIGEFDELDLTVESLANCGLTVQGLAVHSDSLADGTIDSLPARYRI